MSVIKKVVSRVKKEKKVIPREDVLRSRPIRNPLISWELEESGEIKLTIPLQKSWKVSLLSFLFKVPKQKVVMLDHVGSEVWIMCDGKNRVEDLVSRLVDLHKLSRKEVEISLFSYLQQLARRGYMGSS